MSTQGPIDFEKNNLEAHVDLCAERYRSLDERLTNIENKFVKLEELIKDGQTSMAKIVIGAAGTVVTGCLSILFVLLSKN
jgi:hypothetical protein